MVEKWTMAMAHSWIINVIYDRPLLLRTHWTRINQNDVTALGGVHVQMCIEITCAEMKWYYWRYERNHCINWYKSKMTIVVVLLQHAVAQPNFYDSIVLSPSALLFAPCSVALVFSLPLTIITYVIAVVVGLDVRTNYPLGSIVDDIVSMCHSVDRRWRIHLKWLAVTPTATTQPANELWSISIIASIVDLLYKVSELDESVGVYFNFVGVEFAFRIWTHLFHRICIYLIDFSCRSAAFHLCTLFATKIVFVRLRQICVHCSLYVQNAFVAVSHKFAFFSILIDCALRLQFILLLFGRLFVSPCIVSPLFS